MLLRPIVKKVKRSAFKTVDSCTTALNVLGSIKARIPIISSVRFNFITLHYTYIISCALACSVVIYPGGNLKYIDALLFGSGSSTQSGLNPVDLNRLSTYQQVGLWFVSMITNPIVIHSFVVFIRLYWFERRFQHIVADAKIIRRSKSRARTFTRGIEDSDDRDYNQEERGVRGRPIVLVRDNSAAQQNGHLAVPGGVKDGESTSTSDSSTGKDFDATLNSDDQELSETEGNKNPQPTAGDDENNRLRVPAQLGAEHHIAFLESQRNQRGALRIPSPREYDRGGVPQSLDDTDGGELTRQRTSQSDHGYIRPPNDPSAAQPSTGQHITIDEPDIVRVRSRTTTFPRATSRHRSVGLPDREGVQERPRRGTFSTLFRSTSQEELDSSPYLSWQPTVGRNSAFVDLTDEQRNELGGIEYRALKALAVVLVGYFFFFHFLGIVCLVPWIMKSKRFGKVVTDVGQGRPWWAVFMAGSAFNDQGFAITPDSMVSFYDAIFPLLLMTFLIIIGNTGFPCMLRFVIWLCSHLVPHGGPIWEEFRFLLDHPRRCFTLLFPRAATWWLFGVVVLLNVVDLILFIILDLNNPDIRKIPGGIRFVDGLFQAAATRTAGLSVINLADIHPAVQVSYMIMMYISVFPIAISVRRTNVYEEGSLGIYSTPEEDEEDETLGSKEFNYVGAHLRRQLSFDLWYIFLGLFIISIVEASRLENINNYAFTMFSIMFEIVSAYGTVGLSLGYPGTNTSFCAQFKPLSKLIIIAMEIRGRHRGLPYQLDRAILLPSESLHRKELQDANKRLRRRGSALSTFSAVTGQHPPGPFRAETGISSAYQRDGAASIHFTEPQFGPPPSGTATTRLSTHHEAA
ncbi:low affinity potassium transporter [Onygenales sp. PD_40]|nr:low affinity potassium transporter [Onygenales sp. PD_40]KAK2794557.1 low affinity potassium transporter [Onygenales sp. PD_12]